MLENALCTEKQRIEWLNSRKIVIEKLEQIFIGIKVFYNVAVHDRLRKL